MSLYDFNEKTNTDEYGVCHDGFSLRDEIEYNFMRAKEKERQQSLRLGAVGNDYLGRRAAEQRVLSRQNMTPTQPDYSQPASLGFDGKNLTWYENGKPVKHWQAMSGKPDFQSSKYTNVKGYGPIPQGNYLLAMGSGEDYDNKEEMSTWRRFVPIYDEPWYELPESWGKSRIPIKPQTGTNTFGRSSMYVHGGTVPGSAGCIDLTTYNDDFYNDFKLYDADLPLVVKYPKGW